VTSRPFRSAGETRPARRPVRRIAALLLVMTPLLMAANGCPVDGQAVITDSVSAALTAVVKSLVDSLSTYLAGT
jgi:hypothetical protein